MSENGCPKTGIVCISGPGIVPWNQGNICRKKGPKISFVFRKYMFLDEGKDEGFLVKVKET